MAKKMYTMHELILVGIGNTATARTAAQSAARMAAATGVALHIVTAFDRHESSAIGVR
jgi:K+-sensing histidine kinase KdpD